MKRLYLSETDKKIAGVCGGIGEYLERDSTVIRILFIILILFSFGFGVLAYIVMWLIIPNRPADYTPSPRPSPTGGEGN
ncbi:MAG: PspC domain-containing protein [Deltaproteobacteria bacterium]|nr:PspC domain-containing protein [Deltaproteobacteria bacterium]